MMPNIRISKLAEFGLAKMCNAHAQPLILTITEKQTQYGKLPLPITICLSPARPYASRPLSSQCPKLV